MICESASRPLSGRSLLNDGDNVKMMKVKAKEMTIMCIKKTAVTKTKRKKSKKKKSTTEKKTQ